MPISVRSRGRLPHWSKPDAYYFITFRTFDSLSPDVLAALNLSRFTPDEKRKSIESALDRCDRGDILRGTIAETVASSIQYGDGRDYVLHAWCVMPNHVHLLIQTVKGKRLSSSIQALKSATAHNINRQLGKSGPVWEREYFDRIVRPENNKDAVVRYILNNPLKANLQKWEWVGSTLPELRC